MIKDEVAHKTHKLGEKVSELKITKPFGSFVCLVGKICGLLSFVSVRVNSWLIPIR